MKIFGVEIARAKQTAALAPVSLDKQLQKTKPSIPLKSAQPRADLGDSGTRLLHGIITEEYNSQLQGIEGIRIFDEMRKSDGTVRAMVLVTTLPIRRATWFIKPADEKDTQSKDIANFVEHALFDWIDITWDDVLRQALLMVPFGVMLFEKVYTTKDYEGKTYVTLEKLAPRLPKSILRWELPDMTFGIQQIRQDGVLAMIPGSKLLIFVNEREGDNWWGTSMLRAAYKHWYHKNTYYKIDGIAFERQGVGVPVMHMPEGYTDSDEKKAMNALQNLRANENTGLILPNGYTFEFANMGASSTRDPEAAIMHHNREIMKSVLAQFIELGAQSKSGSGGARALSQDHSDLFLKSIESIASTIKDVINRDLIPELVDMNFDGVQDYPTLDFEGIYEADVSSISAAYAQLVTAGAVTPSDSDEPYFRAMLGLPALTQDEIDERDAEEAKMEAQMQTDPNQDPNADTNTEDKPVADKKPVEDAAKKEDKKPAPKKKASEPHKRRTFSDQYKSWRPLTFAEQKVTWSKIETTMDTMDSDFSAKAKELLTNAKDAYVVKLHKALADGDAKAIKDIEIKFAADYKALLKSAMQDAYIYGKNNASTEMNVSPPPNTAASLAEIDLQADTIANKTANELLTKAKIAAMNALAQDVHPLEAAGNINGMLDDAIDRSIQMTGALVVPQSMNRGRGDVFQRNSDSIYALQRSEILDKQTCNFCLSMDGRIVSMDDDWASTDVFHADCRGIWVEILKDESNPPEIGGVPDSLDAYYDGQPNALTQPPRPIVDKGSLADDYVQSKK